MLNPYNLPRLAIANLSRPADGKLDANVHTHHDEVVHNERDSRFKQSRQKECEGIFEEGGVYPLSQSQLPADANIIGNCFVSIKKETGPKFYIQSEMYFPKTPRQVLEQYC